MGELQQGRAPGPLCPPPARHSELLSCGELRDLLTGLRVQADGPDVVSQADRPDQLDHCQVIDGHRVLGEGRMADHPGNVHLEAGQADLGGEVSLAEDGAGEPEAGLAPGAVCGGDQVLGGDQGGPAQRHTGAPGVPVDQGGQPGELTRLGRGAERDAGEEISEAAATAARGVKDREVCGTGTADNVSSLRLLCECLFNDC